MKLTLIAAFYLVVVLYLLVEDLKDPESTEEGRAYYLKLAFFIAWPVLWVLMVLYILRATARRLFSRKKVKA